MATTSLLRGLRGIVGRLNASFSDIGAPNIVGCDATDNFSNVAPVEWPKKHLADYNLAVINRGSMKNLQ